MTREGVERFWVLTAAALSVFVLYAPQPLLPLFANLYGVNEPTAGLIMTATMLPLAIAPLSYGYLLGYVQALGLLRVSLLLVAILTGVTGLVQTFPQLLIVRFLQGMIIPASLTAVMAFLAQPGKSSLSLQRNMSLYVTATISGGFLGRFFAGVSSVFIDWQIFFYALAALLALCFYMVNHHQGRSPSARKAPPVGRQLSFMQAAQPCLPVYLAIFLLFFVFCGVLNYLPFRTMDLTGSRSGLLAGIMYCGYITGIMTSMGAGKIIKLVGSRARVMIGGYILFVLVLLGMLIPNTLTLFILLFPFCGAMFLVHCVATAVVNSRAEGNRGVASALYVSCYYSGGVLGSYFPGVVFKGQGWGAMVVALAGFGLLGAALLVVYFRKNLNG
jgi:YNFM family putative membrane transporter